jgi:hypothetical protein
MFKLRSLCVIAAAAAMTIPAASAFAGDCDSFRGAVSIPVGGGHFGGAYYGGNNCAPRYVERHYVAPRPCYDRKVVRHVKVVRHGGYHGHGHHHGSHWRGGCD